MAWLAFQDHGMNGLALKYCLTNIEVILDVFSTRLLAVVCLRPVTLPLLESCPYVLGLCFIFRGSNGIHYHT